MDINKQIAAWKKAGHTVLAVSFDDGKEVYFKRPNRRELKLILSKGPKGGSLVMAESFIANCYLGGDVKKEDFKSNEDMEYLTQLTASVDDLIGFKKVEVKKL